MTIRAVSTFCIVFFPFTHTVVWPRPQRLHQDNMNNIFPQQIRYNEITPAISKAAEIASPTKSGILCCYSDRNRVVLW